MFLKGVRLSFGKSLSPDWEKALESKGQGQCDLGLPKKSGYLDSAQLTTLFYGSARYSTKDCEHEHIIKL